MRSEEIYRHLHQEPFRPFRLRLSNGIVHEIRHPEMAMPTASCVIVGLPAKDALEPAVGDYVIVSLIHIVQLEPLEIAVSPSNN